MHPKACPTTPKNELICPGTAESTGALGELLAFGSLLVEGVKHQTGGVRTALEELFVQRHSGVFTTEIMVKNGLPFDTFSEQQAKFEGYNSFP